MTSEYLFRMAEVDMAWCPGCGNFGIHQAVSDVLGEMGKDPTEVVMVSGIGQAAKMPQYLNLNMFNGLHGRALPPATGIKAVNPELTVIAESGDGDMYGEGGNHFMHTIRRNPDIAHIVHDNMIYGLTKGQASPTSWHDIKTPVQPGGVILEPFNPLAVALSLGAGFVARSFSQDRVLTRSLIREAIEFEGYALVDILQPCVTFNKFNTYSWFKENTARVPDDHDPADLMSAFELSRKLEPIPLGIIYKNKGKEPFHRELIVYEEDRTPLMKRNLDRRNPLKEELSGMV